MTKGSLFLMASCYDCCIRLAVCWLLVVITLPLLYGYNGYQDFITIRLGLSSG